MRRLLCCTVVAGCVLSGFGASVGALPAEAWKDSVWLSVPDAPVSTDIAKDGSCADKGTSWFVRELVNEADVVQVKWMTAGLGVYDVYVNGRRIGEDFLKPGFTHYAKTKYAFTYDVTKEIKTGSGERNVFAAEVSAGWWRDKIVTPAGTDGFVGKKSAFRGVIELTFADGSKKLYGTNVRDWKAGIAGPVAQAAIFDGEHYDARQVPGFAEWAGFGMPEINEEFKGEILPTDGAEVVLRTDKTLKPIRAYSWKGVEGVTQEAYGKVKIVREFNPKGPFSLERGETLVVDFGQNAAAIPDFSFAAPEGTKLTIRPAEMLNDGNGLKSRGNDGPEGSVYRANLRTGWQTMRLATYVFSGRGVESYHPRFTFFGFRYVSLTADGPVRIERLASIPVSSIRREQELGSITTGDEALNRFIGNVYWSQLSNYLSIPSDCPQRNERLGWTADTQIFADAAGFTADVYDFLRKWMRDLRDGQSRTGGFPCVAPAGQYGLETMRFGWSDAGVIVPYKMWKQFGDTRIVEENWAAMERFVSRVAETRYEHAAIAEECANYQYNDWLSLTRLESQNRPCYKPEYSAFLDDKKRVPKPEALRYWDFMGGCFWIGDAEMMSEMAAATGREDAARKYRAMAETARNHVRKAFFATQDGTIDPLFAGMQTPALFALKYNLVSGDARKRTVDKLVASIAAEQGALHTGFLGTPVALETLTANGHGKLAYDLLLRHGFPGWLYSVDQGATTVWERWNSYTKKTGFGPSACNSFNHYAYGSVLSWLYERAAGIAADPSAPGFRHVLMRPVPDRRLKHLEAEYKSASGTIKSAWRYAGDEWVWTFTIPAGVTASVQVPGAQKARTYSAGTYTLKTKISARVEDLPEVKALIAPGAKVETAAAGSNGWVVINYEKDIEKGSALDFSNWGILDAPAGKYGRVIARNGHFEFEDKSGKRLRFYGANLCSGGLFMPDCEIDRLLTRFERLGYNTFRIHHYDNKINLLEKSVETNRMDRLDKLIAEAGKRGFYLAIDLFTIREAKWTDCGFDRPGVVPWPLYKLLIGFHEGAYRDWEQFARRVMKHRNPHNGLTWAEDPAIAFIDLVNEGANPISRSMNQDELSSHPVMLEAWKKFLKQKRSSDPDYAPEAVPDVFPLSNRNAATVEFVSEMEDRLAARQTALLREIGYAGLITSNNNRGRDFAPMQQAALARYDYRDCHFYHDHCQAIGNRPQTSLPQRYPITSPYLDVGLSMTQVAYERLPQMPFTVSEFSFPVPSPYRASGTLMTGAFAALQDWDGLWHFAYSHRLPEFCEDVPGAYDIARDVLNQMAERMNIAVFLREDVRSLENGLCMELTGLDGENHPRGFAWRAFPDAELGGWSWGDAAWKSKVGSSFGGIPGWRMVPRAKAEDPSGMVMLEGLAWDPQMRIVRRPSDNAHFELVTDRTCAGCSVRVRDLITVGPLSFRVSIAQSSVACTSLDGLPLCRSKRILLTHLTDAIGEGARWVKTIPVQVEGRKTANSIAVLSWGRGRTLVKDGAADIELALEDAAAYQVYALATSGRRLERVPTNVVDGKMRFRARVKGADGKGRLAYEIVKETK